MLRLAEAAGCPVHLAHMQTARSIDAVRRAKARGVDVTCEVNHWGPFLSKWEDVQTLGPYALSYWVPDEGREAIWQGMRDGTIDICSSDHAPHTREEKEVGWTQMWSAHTGTPGIQYYYPLLLDAVNKGELTLERVVEMVATTPARAFGLAGVKGVAAGRRRRRHRRRGPRRPVDDHERRRAVQDRLDAVRRPQDQRRASTAPSCGVPRSTPTASSSARPGMAGSRPRRHDEGN